MNKNEAGELYAEKMGTCFSHLENVRTEAKDALELLFKEGMNSLASDNTVIILSKITECFKLAEEN